MDLDAFFAAVEVLEDPRLAGKPLIVGGRPEARGVVATASYAARRFGVHSAMPTYRALQLCPEALILPTRHTLYRRYSQRVMAILHETSSVVEKVSIDEAYLDLRERVTAWAEGEAIARRIQTRVREEVGLSASLGVATNKLVAKVASDHEKPSGLTVVRPGEEAAFLAPLDVRVIWGVGPVTAERLAGLGVTTVGDLARTPEEDLSRTLGDHGVALRDRARGIDRRPVVTEHERKSVSQERTFKTDLRDLRALKVQLWQMSQQVARRLNRDQEAARTIGIKLRYADFETLTRQMQLDVPTAEAKMIYQAALVLLREHWDRREAIRLLGVSAQQLCAPSPQMRLFEGPYG